MTSAAEATMSKQPLDPGAVVETSLGVRGLEIDDELILFDPLTDRSFRINSTGRAIWALLSERLTIGDVADALERQYGLDREEAREITSTYVAQLSQLGLAAIQGETSTS